MSTLISEPLKSNGTRRLPADVEEQLRQSSLYLWRLMRERSMPAVVFTSATSGEGTTTTVTEVARLFRDALGLRPLLIRLNDPSDKRNAQTTDDELAHQDLLALSNGQGLPDCVKHGPHSIPTIARLNHTPASIQTTRLQTAVARVLRERAPSYNVVLIDAPAVLASADTMAVCEVVPQVVLVVAAGKTRYEVVERVTNELRDHDVTIVGTILNKHRRVIPNWFYRTFVN
jgi:protein-tyrosine kinase